MISWQCYLAESGHRHFLSSAQLSGTQRAADNRKYFWWGTPGKGLWLQYKKQGYSMGCRHQGGTYWMRRWKLQHILWRAIHYGHFLVMSIPHISELRAGSGSGRCGRARRSLLAAGAPGCSCWHRAPWAGWALATARPVAKCSSGCVRHQVGSSGSEGEFWLAVNSNSIICRELGKKEKVVYYDFIALFVPTPHQKW